MNNTEILKICDEIKKSVKKLSEILSLEMEETKQCDLPFTIKGVFFSKDRLNELDEVPKLADSRTDYWLAGKLLCEKDGGRLPTMEELAKLGAYLYEDDNGNHPNVGAHEDIGASDYTFNIKKAKELGLKNWNGSEITEDNVNVDLWSSVQASDTLAYLRGFDTNGISWSHGGRYDTCGQVLCVGDE